MIRKTLHIGRWTLALTSAECYHEARNIVGELLSLGCKGELLLRYYRRLLWQEDGIVFFISWKKKRVLVAV